MVFKLISLIIMAICAVIAFIIPIFLPEEKYKNFPMRRVKIIVRTRLGCILAILILLFICIII